MDQCLVKCYWPVCLVIQNWTQAICHLHFPRMSNDTTMILKTSKYFMLQYFLGLKLHTWFLFCCGLLQNHILLQRERCKIDPCRIGHKNSPVQEHKKLTQQIWIFYRSHCTCTGAIMTAWPPGEGMMKAGIGPAPLLGRGWRRGRPRPRFTEIY